MAITYGTATNLTDLSRMNSLTNGQAKAFGPLTFAGEIANDVQVKIPLQAGQTSGTLTLYLIQSQDNTTWTDGIDPTSAADQLGKIKDARPLRTTNGIYNATNRTFATFNVTIPAATSAKYVALVLANNTNAATASTGAAGTSTTKSVS